jgi:hypothetical protein
MCLQSIEGHAVKVTDEELQQCGRIAAPVFGELSIQKDPDNKTLADGLYFVGKRLQGNRWVMSVYRDRCEGTNEIEVAIEPSRLAKLRGEQEVEVRSWLEQQRTMLQNDPPFKRITNAKVNSFCMGFKLQGAQEFLRRLTDTLAKTRGRWDIAGAIAETGTSGQPSPRDLALEHMLSMAYQAAAASGTEHIEVAKDKKVLFASREAFLAYVDSLLKEPVCAVSGVPLDLTFADVERAPSLDRKDSDGHYEEGNLQVVARFINRWKSDDDIDNFKRLLALTRKVDGGDQTSA